MLHHPEYFYLKLWNKKMTKKPSKTEYYHDYLNLNQILNSQVLNSDKIGKQAIIMSLPVSIVENKIKKFNYITKKIESIPKNFLKYIHNNLISEIMLIDYINEGSINKFNIGLIKKFQNKNIPLILFGGVGEKSIILNTIKYNNVSAIAIGNSLNYSENKVQSLKSLSKKYFRELNNGH